jgi:hypothetical protein
MLDKGSLQTLVTISQHEVLGPAVRTLGVCTEHFSSTLSEVYDLKSDCDGLSRALEEQSRLLDNGQDLAYLTEAMTGLINCRTVALTDTHIPWGGARLQKEANRKLVRGVHYDSDADQRFMSHLLTVMFAAVAQSRLPIENVDLRLGRPEETSSGFPLSLELLDIDRDTIPLATVSTLRLGLCSPHGVIDAATTGVRVEDFFKLFPRVTCCTVDFEDIFGDHRVFSDVARYLYLEQVRILELTRSEGHVPELCALIWRHQSTLEHLALRRMGLYGAGAWAEVLSTIRDLPNLRSFNMEDCLFAGIPFTSLSEKIPIPEIVSVHETQELEELAAQIELAIASHLRGDHWLC